MISFHACIQFIICSFIRICYYFVCIEERAVEEGHNSNKPSKDYTVVIIALSAAGLIVIFTIVTAFIALRYECKKSKLRRPNTSSRYRNL